jgi:hypothetical protein
MTCTGPYFLFFCRGFKLVGPMVIMVYRMLAQVSTEHSQKFRYNWYNFCSVSIHEEYFIKFLQTLFRHMFFAHNMDDVLSYM